MCEHYMPTVLAYKGVGEQTTCRNDSVVDVNWREVRCPIHTVCRS